MADQGRLKDKVAIITGAASGIGSASAVLFANEGARLVLADVDEKGLKEVAGLISEAHAAVVIKKTDVTGDITGLEQQDKNIWHQVYDVNVLGAVFAVKHIAKHMQERKSGAIVNTSSVAGIRAGAGGNAYSASKAALINFTRTAACDLGGYNIRVNAVCPGLIETGMTKPIFDYAREAGKESKLGSRCELRRYGNPREVANAILFLASDESSYITGQILAVDGGNTASLNLPGMKV
jgi:NAD(P)-dependent dehydrogenase (short-subunit alcohol dehydrogenase family)